MFLLYALGMKIFFGYLKKFLFPHSCAVCGLFGEILCKSCFDLIELEELQECPECRIKNQNGVFCNSYCRGGFVFTRLIRCGSYKNDWRIRKLIYAFKYSFRKELKDSFR